MKRKKVIQCSVVLTFFSQLGLLTLFFRLVFVFLSVLLVTHPAMAGKQELQAVVRGNGVFTQQLYNVLCKKEGNVFFSPISAHAVLSMAFQGANGSTLEAFSKTLNLPDTGVAAEGYHDVINHLNNVADVQLSMANKIYIMDKYTLKPKFQEVTQNKFSSEVQPVDFAKSDATAKIINAWVEDKTKNKIKDLIKPDMLDALTRLVLVNAIYFKGNWASKFEPRQTKKEQFWLNNSDSVEVDMMNTKGKYMYKEDEALDAKVLELPYSNPDISLIVILPNKKDGIAELEKKLTETDLTSITHNMYKPEVIIKLPKFKIETTIELNDPLTEMGLGVIFDPDHADFTEMLTSPEQLYVSKVIQKAFIEVNEEGTEAAAATAVVVNYIRASVSTFQPQPKVFHADHSFILNLAYKKQTILFTGRISSLKNE